jgi:prepilin peptidase CpaA
METGLTMLFVLVMVVAMAWDATTLEIPDTASIVLAVGFLGGAIVRDAGLSTILQHIAAGLALFAVGAGLFRLGIWGGGDVKFMAAIGLWFGWGGLPAWLFMVVLAGGVLALAILVLRHAIAAPASWWPGWLNRLHRRDEGIPYGIALGAGGLLVLDRATAFLPGTGVV